MLKKIFFIIIINIILLNNLNAKSGFEYFGDVMQALPVYLGVYSLAIQDYDGLIQLTLGTSITLLATYAIKYSFEFASKKYPNQSYISQRPNNGVYNGFPSGHTSFAFSAVGIAYKRYGYKVFIPTTILATLTGISRIYADRHTTTQVVWGGAIGFIISYVFARKFEENNMFINVLSTKNNGYMISFSKSF